MSNGWPRVTVSGWGEPKKGKSHFALTFPEPIQAIEIGETGIEDLLNKPEFRDKKITHTPITMPVLSPEVADHQKLLTRFEKVLLDSVKLDSGYRTLVIDSASRLWRSVRLVMTEKALEDSIRKKRSQADYELANDYFEQIIQLVRVKPDLNLVLLHRHRDVWRTQTDENGRDRSGATGEVEARDYKGIENMVQVVLKFNTGTRFDAKTKGQIESFMHTIQLCRPNHRVVGLTVPDLDYNTLMERVWGRAAAATE